MNGRTRAVTAWAVLLGAGLCTAILAAGGSAEMQMAGTTPPVFLASVDQFGGFPNSDSTGAVTSADGRCVAYYSTATDIVPGYKKGLSNVYAYDRDLDQTVPVSVSVTGNEPNGPSMAQGFRPSIDGGCTCVGFSSDAMDLVDGDSNGKTDVFLRDLSLSTTLLVSTGLGGAPANGGSSFTSVTADCGKVAFQSVATNLVPDDTNKFSDIFVLDRGAGVTTRVSVGAGGEEANGSSISPSISADGRCVAFASAATNFIRGDTNGTMDIYVACDGAVTCRASVSSEGVAANGMSFLPSLNSDGSIVAFKSIASNLVPGDTNGANDVFVHSCATGETVRASVGDMGQQGNDNAIPGTISGDGRFVAFSSFAGNLIVGVNTGGNPQAYVRDLQADTTILVSTSPLGQPGNEGVPDIPPSISLDGEWVAFDSLATNLVSGDAQGFLDAFIRANATVPPTATPTATGPTPTATPTGPTPTATSTGPTATATPTATGTGTATHTPTAEIPCTQDTDCPVGQVCGPDDHCQPAPTPTPTIACMNTDDCPPGLVCIDGGCRDLSTPTPTPTPLPPCVVDADCPDGYVCRARVCVPRRPCEEQAECRGVRETCLDNACECGGDCTLDGIVFGSDITKMVCVMSGVCPLSDCEAGDINQDGEITSGDVTLAVINLGLGCPGEGSPLLFALDRTNETRSLDVGDITGIPGQVVHFPIGLSGGGDVTTAQVDILYPLDLFELSLTEPVCTLDERIYVAGSFEPEVTLPQVPRNPEGMGRLRVAVVDKYPPIESFGEGPLFHCTFRIQPGAVPASSQLAYDLTRLEIADPNANPFNATVTGGAIQVNERPPCTSSEECPEGTECKGGECRPKIACSGPMAGPGECLDDRQACVNDFCQCVGDCDDDGVVRSNEISEMIAIINGEIPLSECPAADWNGDGIVRSNDISIAIFNVNNGCP